MCDMNEEKYLVLHTLYFRPLQNHWRSKWNKMSEHIRFGNLLRQKAATVQLRLCTHNKSHERGYSLYTQDMKLVFDKCD